MHRRSNLAASSHAPTLRPGPCLASYAAACVVLCLVLCLVLGSFLATPATAGGPAGDTLEEGAAALAPFKRDLMAALQKGLAEGPVEAVAACRTRAPEIARSLSRDGVRVGRSSHRLRNPDNAAPDWVAPILDDFVAHPERRRPTAAALPGGRRGVVEPILLKPLCATCHGVELAPALADRIDALYPEDRAVGFEVGDLRGVFWVELPPVE